jgi:hypothetical protein
MTIANFKARIYGFINRASTVFTTSDTASIDHVLAAMNDARRAAQKEYAFELCRADVFLTTSEVGANWMTGCKTTPDGGTAALMKRIDSVWNYSTNTIPAGTAYIRTTRIDFGHVNDFRREVGVDGGSEFSSQTATGIQIFRRKFAYMNGQNLCVVSVDTAAPLLLNGIKFLDDLTGNEDTDIFMVYFADWFFWATLIQLNQYLKDDQRLNIDASFVGRLWQAVKEMDGQIANSGDNATLD